MKAVLLTDEQFVAFQQLQAFSPELRDAVLDLIDVLAADGGGGIEADVDEEVAA